MFGKKTHKEVAKAFQEATGKEVTTRTVAKWRRNESAATKRVNEILKESGKTIENLSFRD